MAQDQEKFLGGEDGGQAIPEGFVDDGQVLPQDEVEAAIRELLGDPEGGE